MLTRELILALVKEARERANEMPAEIAADENEKSGHCGDYGDETAADYLDAPDVLLLHDLCDAIETLLKDK